MGGFRWSAENAVVVMDTLSLTDTVSYVSPIACGNNEWRPR